jgi:processing peptidase subunit alpha
VPETKITTLSNGVRVGSMETFSQVSTLGVVLDYGSRYESNSMMDPKTNTLVSTAGVNHIMELLAFQSTKLRSGFEIQTIMEKLGGATFATSSREQFLYGVDVLRPNAAEAFHLLGETVNVPMVYDEELEQMKQVIEFQLMDMNPQILLGEGLQMAGYGVRDGELQQLGRPHFCKSNLLEVAWCAEPLLLTNLIHE